ncbi:MAG: N-acetylglutaminylglutamine synthetase [Magnetococcales bacterium]|nr:N-acetylglutaminylglutamine synthetase [Magnetococcales bacterium]
MSNEELPSTMDPQKMASLKHWGDPPDEPGMDQMQKNVVVDCGWGRLIFGQTFEDSSALVEVLREEKEGRRDLALYVRDPHVLISHAPQELFLDPSHTYRLAFDGQPLGLSKADGFSVSLMKSVREGEEANRILAQHGMIRVGRDSYQQILDSEAVSVFIAKDNRNGAILGIATGVDHHKAINDPDNGSSLWSIAVDPQCPYSGVGERIVVEMARLYRDHGRSFLDLSVFHNNNQAISLYEKLGFEKVPVYCLKHKNCINEKLFSGPQPGVELNIYSRIIIDEARRRGIMVDVLDRGESYFKLTFGGRSITCRESLSELTSAIAMSRCQDKSVTLRLLKEAALSVPEQISAADREEVEAFIQHHQRVVVKPANGEQGQNVRVDLRGVPEVLEAIETIGTPAKEIIVEELVRGEDLRIIVIDEEVVAAAVRKPPLVTGNGQQTVSQLIEKQSRRRSAATHGESQIPMDDETIRCVRQLGYQMDSVLPVGVTLTVRKTANLHTGGVIQDVTPILNPILSQAAVTAAQTLDIPVVGLDFMVPDVRGSEYYIIEANERPGLANHEPQPTAERFIDLLFPQTRPMSSSCVEPIL